MFDPKEFMDVSRRLCTAGSCEADYRTSISRSLYATFLWLREELEAHHQHVKEVRDDIKSNEHANVRRCFEKGPYRHDSVKDRLTSLYKLRYNSDYHLEVQIQQADALEALGYSDYVFEKCTRMFHPPTSHPQN